jgi:hypothetical protein
MYSKSPWGGASGVADVDFSGTLSSTSPIGVAFEGLASTRTLVVLVVIASLASSDFSPDASAEAGTGAFIDSKISSKTLAILLFLGVAVVVLDGFDSPVTAGGLSTFGCSAVFSDFSSFTGLVLASIDMVGAVSMAEGAASTLLISFGTSIVPIGFGLHVKTSRHLHGLVGTVWYPSRDGSITIIQKSLWYPNSNCASSR